MPDFMKKLYRYVYPFFFLGSYCHGLMMSIRMLEDPNTCH
jgi:hypothetical protein